MSLPKWLIIFVVMQNSAIFRRLCNSWNISRKMCEASMKIKCSWKISNLVSMVSWTKVGSHLSSEILCLTTFTEGMESWKNYFLFARSTFWSFFQYYMIKIDHLVTAGTVIIVSFTFSCSLHIILLTFSYQCNGRKSIVFGSNFWNRDFERFACTCYIVT